MDKNYTILVGLILIMIGAFGTSGGIMQIRRQGSFKFMKIALFVMALGWAVFLFGYYVQNPTMTEETPKPLPSQTPTQVTQPVMQTSSETPGFSQNPEIR